MLILLRSGCERTLKPLQPPTRTWNNTALHLKCTECSSTVIMDTHKTRLIKHVTQIIEESADHKEFDVAAWVDQWLAQPAQVLNGRPPMSYMDTDEGVDLLCSLLSRSQLGVFS